MREAAVGRVLVASLHQGIADVLPSRLVFYENWLNAEGLREGTIRLAPLYAVLSFLRLEGDAYQRITARASSSGSPASSSGAASVGTGRSRGCERGRRASRCVRRCSAPCASRHRS